MILPDHEIRTLGIVPFTEGNLQPASYDMTLSPHFLSFNEQLTHIDPKEDITSYMDHYYVTDDPGCIVLHPGELLLGATIERVHVPQDIVGRVEGKSSLGRLGLLIHSTAGFIDPGFEGTITLELVNVSGRPIKLYPGMKICQISFMAMTARALLTYGQRDNKYQGQSLPTPSKYFTNFSN